MDGYLIGPRLEGRINWMPEHSDRWVARACAQLAPRIVSSISTREIACARRRLMEPILGAKGKGWKITDRQLVRETINWDTTEARSRQQQRDGWMDDASKRHFSCWQTHFCFKREKTEGRNLIHVEELNHRFSREFIYSRLQTGYIENMQICIKN